MVLLTPTTTGPLRYAHTFSRGLGGAESNVAIGLARLGKKAGWMSRVGNDELGEYVVSIIRGEGVD
ncbi:MAG: PfkB family carbohydrate kinase, partial [Novibacillus thermophilus]